ncbi:MAG: TonB-dependent receptor [Acidobacteriia bacterium]|nr:TonB-dependent receptor [Terriglobia bacterium]
MNRIASYHEVIRAFTRWAQSFRTVAWWVPANVAFIMVAGYASAQTTTGTITGTVIDQSGTAIPSAKVSVTNEATGDTRTTTTTANGDFNLPSLLPATYTVQVEVTGFQTYRSTGNVLTPNGRLALGQLRLAVGAVTETLEINAQAAQVSTQSAENSGQITRDQFSMIPVKGRDLTSIMRTLPGVQMVGDQDAFGAATGFGATMGAAEGVRNDSQNLTVDGIVANDMGAPAGLSGQVNMDAVEEVKVLLSSYQAEYGRNPGTNISMITRAGTKQFHGGAYYYVRNDFFNANDFFRNASPNSLLNVGPAIYRFSTFGGTFGGPFPLAIPKLNTNKEKLFFFYSYDDTNSRIPNGSGVSAITYYNQPTALEKQGNFSQSVPGGMGTNRPIDPLTGAPFPNGIIPASRINPIGQALINVYPAPNVPNNGSYNYEVVPILTIPNWQHVFRIDEKLNSSNSIYFRGALWHKDTHGPGGTVGYGATELWPYLDSHYQYYDDSMALNYTHIWSPSIISDFTAGVRHSTERENNDNFQAVAQKGSRAGLGISSLGYLFPPPGDNPFNLVPNITYTNTTFPTLFGFGTRFDQPGSDVQFNITHATTFVLNQHTIKAGIFFDRGRDIEGRAGASNGAFDFGLNPTNPLNSGNAFANQLLGNFYQYSEANTRIPLLMFRYVVDWYIQDTWRVTKRLTLDYGIRFDHSSWFHQNDGRASDFVPSLYNPADAPRLYQPAIINGQRVAYDPVTGQTLSQAFISGYVPGTGSLSNGMLLQNSPGVPEGFAKQPGTLPMPRFGLAWDIFGDGKTALRTGGGIFRLTEDDGVNFGLKTVWGQQPGILTANVFNSNISNLVAGTGYIFPTQIGGLDLSTRPTYYNFDFGIQRDLGASLLLDVKYVGGLGRHLIGGINVNELPLGAQFQHPDPTSPGQYLIPNLLRPYPGYGDIIIMTDGDSSSYNALQATLNRRFSSGLEFGLSYTYSKSMDYNSQTRPSSTPLVCCLTPTYLPASRNYGPSDFNQTQVLTVNWQYDIPSFKEGNKLVIGVTRHWQISGVASFSDGVPLTITPIFLSNTLGGGDPQRINLTCNPNLSRSNRSVAEYFNTSCVQFPGGTIGNSGRNNIKGPGRNNFDFALFRNFNLGNEKRTLVFRAEAYNAFNHLQINTIDTSPRYTAAGAQIDPTFGQALSAYPARQLQFSLRLRF